MRARRRPAVSRFMRLERRLLVPRDLQARGVSAALTPEQLAAVEERDTALFVHANAGSGKTRVLVERFVRAVVEDGVAGGPDPRDHVHREGGRRAEGPPAPAVPRPRRARPRARGRGRVGLDHPRVLLEAPAPARAARRASTRSTRSSTRRARRGWRSTRSTARWRTSSTRTSPSGWTWPRPTRRTACAAWSRRSTRSGAARGRSGRSCRRERSRRLGDERERARRGARGRARRAGRAGRVVERRRGDREARALPRRARGACREGEVGDPAAFAALAVKTGRTKALQGDAMQAAGAALEAWVAACAARRAHGDYVLLRELLRGYTRPLRGGQGRASRRSTSTTSSCSRAGCSRTTRRSASATASSSSTCSWTSSRTRTGSRSACSGCWPARTDGCSPSATSSSRSTGSGTPT